MKTKNTSGNWAKGRKKKLDDRQIALKQKAEFDKQNKGKKMVIKDHPTSPRAKIVTYK